MNETPFGAGEGILRFPEHRSGQAAVPAPGNLCHASPVAEKVARFRSLFRGREDVYARRFENVRSGRSGYSPACGNEWVKGVCEKPRVKCSDCPNPCWLPVNDASVHWHLCGRDERDRPFVMGVYPMLRDETCWFLAVDFDGAGWRDDVGGFVRMCRERELPVALERSRSGDGAHAWFFFEEAIPAAPDPVRPGRRDGGRLSLRGGKACHRARRPAAPRRRGRLEARPAEGRPPPAARVFCPALPRGRRGKTSRPRARFDPRGPHRKAPVRPAESGLSCRRSGIFHFSLLIRPARRISLPVWHLFF